MAKKNYTKAQARRVMNEIKGKAARLYLDDYFSLKDFDNINKIVKFRFKQWK